MTIDATDLDHVMIDGVDAGHIINAANAFPLLRAQIKAAFDMQRIVADETTATLRQAAAQQVLDAQAEKDAAIAEADAAIAVLGTKEEAQEIIKAQDIAKQDEIIAAATARKAELTK